MAVSLFIEWAECCGTNNTQLNRALGNRVHDGRVTRTQLQLNSTRNMYKTNIVDEM